MDLKKFAQDVFTKAIMRDIAEQMYEDGYIHLTEYGSTVLMCDPKTVSNLLETGKFTSVHFQNVLKNTKGTHLRQVFAEIGNGKI